MKKSVCFALLGLVCLTFTGVNAEGDYNLIKSTNGDSCPKLWSEVKYIDYLKKGQTISSNSIVKSLEVPTYVEMHDGTYKYEGSYATNYYVAKEDSDGNIRYEEYTPSDIYCYYYSEKNSSSKKLTSSKAVSQDTYSLQDYYLILPSVNGTSVNWIYSKDNESTLFDLDTDFLLNFLNRWGEKNWDDDDKELYNYIQTLNENEIYSIKAFSPYDYDADTGKYVFTSRTNNSEVNFFESLEQKTTFKVSCANTAKGKFECSITLNYNYATDKMKVSFESSKISLNNLTAKNGWSISTDNNKVIEFTNDTSEDKFINNIEIATFTVDYTGTDSKDFVESNVSAEVVELTNDLGTFSKDSIANDLSYDVGDVVYEVEKTTETTSSTTKSTDNVEDTTVSPETEENETKNPETGESNLIYLICFGLIAILSGVLAFLKKYNFKKLF